MSDEDAPVFLTTREVAALLRMRERRVYDLAAAGELPCRRVTGRLLFPRDAIEALTGTGPDAAPMRPPRPAEVVAGSHDPLLDWALRASGAGLASLFDGSLDGLARMAAGQAAAAGCHLPGEGGEWNTAAVAARLGAAPVVLVEWAWREVGLLLAPGLGTRVTGLGDLAGRRVALRQGQAGTQVLFERLLADAGLGADALCPIGPPARTEAETAAAVATGEAEAAPGLRAMALAYRLDFLPLATERFDLCVDRRFWFEPPWQRFLGFARCPELARKAAALGGYDVSGFGRVRWNAP